MFSPERAARESSVFEKAAKFDMLAAQGKPHERKVNDAAIKRAVLGREEAEEQARRYRDERNAVQEKYKEEKQNCTKVSRRLEAAIVCQDLSQYSMICTNTVIGEQYEAEGDLRSHQDPMGD